MNGYCGKTLWVDLGSRTVKEEALDEALCRKYLGGYGLGARILFDRERRGDGSKVAVYSSAEIQYCFDTLALCG